MKDLSRRSVLKGLTTLPVVTALHPLDFSRKLAEATPRQAGPAIKTLNVIFHGLFAFVLWKKQNYIQVLAPIVGDHVYKAGGRGTHLQPLAAGQTYTLTGVKDGGMNPGFDPDMNSVFNNHAQIDARAVYCSFLINIPNGIYALRCLPKMPGEEFYTSSPEPLHKPGQLPLVHVLTYSPDSIQPLNLSPLKKLQMYVAGDTANLHVRAEPERMSQESTPGAFDRLNFVFPDLGAQLNPKYGEASQPLDPQGWPGFPHGVDVDDECALVDVLNGCPPPTRPIGKAIQEPPFRTLDGHPINCHSITVINP